MKLAVCSDLHMEFQDYTLDVDPEILYLIAGDVHDNAQIRNEWLNATFPEKNYFFIRGNHDCYGTSLNDPGADCSIRSWRDIRVAGATLWTDLSNYNNYMNFKRGMLDAERIIGTSFDNMNNHHIVHRDFLLQSKADIIVSHHAPSFRSIHPMYRNSGLNASFASNLDERILELAKPPKIWIHGHTHHAFDYMLGDTRVICNPRGYPFEPRIKSYQPIILEV